MQNNNLIHHILYVRLDICLFPFLSTDSDVKVLTLSPLLLSFSSGTSRRGQVFPRAQGRLHSSQAVVALPSSASYRADVVVPRRR